jgi:Arc/MetJ-type ribon-helix-helix transcriptional regulator
MTMQAIYAHPLASPFSTPSFPQPSNDALNLREAVSKISISLDQTVMRFMESYRARHQAKSRSQVVDEALRLLERQESDRLLEQEYLESAEQDRIIMAEFDHTAMDGLEHETW